MEVACATAYLRSLNVLLSAACLAVLWSLLEEYHPHQPAHHKRKQQALQPLQTQPWERKPKGPQGASASSSTPAPACTPALYALVLALYPLHWFFSFLYYTDVASLLFLLLCQLQAIRRQYWGAALAGAVAVLCRQTNAVWTAFVLGESLLAELGMEWAPALQHRAPPEGAAAAASGGAVARAEAVEAGDAATGGLASELQLALVRMWRQRGPLAASMWPLLLPPAGFAAFLVANDGSVVLGDKEAHRPVRHGAQLLYFAAWVAVMLWPQLLPEVGLLAHAARRRPLVAAVTAAAAVAAAAAVGRVSSLVHPYMLADNRHYVFYLWRRLLGRHAALQYGALAPGYAAAWALLLTALLRRVSRLWLVGFAACLAAQLLPAWLLELRYFTPGFYLIALRLAPPTRTQAMCMLATYGAINAATMYLFLYKPYTFADGSTARFIW